MFGNGCCLTCSSITLKDDGFIVLVILVFELFAIVVVIIHVFVVHLQFPDV